MKGMNQRLWSCSLIASLSVNAQDIKYESVLENARSRYATQEPKLYGHCVDSLVVDTVYGSSPFHAEPVLQVHRYPFARYEFYLDGALFRRIDIIQQEESREVGWKPDLGTGNTIGVISVMTIDIPNGAYHEFFPNGNIRIKGTLDGYNPDGTLKKTGEWLEWNADGQVIRRESYP